jgi:N utilization substance protein A
MQELQDIEAFDEETVNELRARARNALLSEAIAKEELVQTAVKELAGVEGMTPELIAVLAENEITTLDELAELATDELSEMTGLAQDAASDLIMRARAHWFDDEA